MIEFHNDQPITDEVCESLGMEIDDGLDSGSGVPGYMAMPVQWYDLEGVLFRGEPCPEVNTAGRLKALLFAVCKNTKHPR